MFRKFVLAALGLIIAAPVYAQSATDEIETERAYVQAHRKEIVAKLMDLTDKEGEAFWPVYNDYREAVRKVGDKMVKLVTDWAEKSDSLTDESSQKLINDWLSLENEQLALQKSYLKKFSKVLPGPRLFRYYQIENKMDAVIDYGLAANIPLQK